MLIREGTLTMKYYKIDYDKVERFCIAAFEEGMASAGKKADR